MLERLLRASGQHTALLSHGVSGEQRSKGSRAEGQRKLMPRRGFQ